MMNLYNFYSKPDRLVGYAEADMKVSEVFWPKYFRKAQELKKREAGIATNPEYSYRYARDILKGPFPLGEDAMVRELEHPHDDESYYDYYIEFLELMGLV